MNQALPELHITLFYICCSISVMVFVVMMYSLIHYRKTKGAEAAHFHKNLAVEVLWTTLPFLILVSLVIPAIVIVKNAHRTDQLINKITLSKEFHKNQN